MNIGAYRNIQHHVHYIMAIYDTINSKWRECSEW